MADEGISTEDKLTLRTLEAEAYKERVAYMEAETRFRGAIDGLNSFIKVVAEKLGKDLSKSALDLKSLTFIDRPQEEK